jgi:glycosyltransferase involved in cell wall biosynthesis
MSQDARIHYHGFISDSELRALQGDADALLSFYLPDDVCAQGRFPSKLLEYLAHLKPVLSTRAPGISPEYDSILRFFNPLQQTSFDDAIRDLMSLTPNEKHQDVAHTYDFLMQNKLWESQAQRLVAFVRQNVTELKEWPKGGAL